VPPVSPSIEALSSPPQAPAAPAIAKMNKYFFIEAM
jgi:hypothetical protein